MTSLLSRSAVRSDQRTIPAALEISLPLILIFGAVLSVFRLTSYSFLPVTTLLDIWVVLFCIAALPWVSKRITGVVVTVLAVAFIRVILVIASESPIVDALQANKWLLYLLAFALAVSRVWKRVGLLIGAMITVLILGATKSVLAFLLYGPRERTGLFVENNFEIPLFCGLLIASYSRLGRYRGWLVVLLGVLVVFSGSRSGSIAYVGVVVFAISASRIRDSFIRYVGVLLLVAVAAVPVWVFQSRAAGATQLDRLNFLEVFQNETASWSPLNWALGTMPITPLSDGACSQLWYYVDLFASSGDGSCYAVILHAFVLRIIFDAGVLGLLFVFGVTWVSMRRGGVQVGAAIALMYVAIANSLSVSGLNNSYVALPIIIAITLAASGRPVAAPDSPQLPQRV